MDYKRLLSFYLACVEEEDRRSKQVNGDARNRQYITPGADAGSLFRHAQEISWTVSHEQGRFLRHDAMGVERLRYLYGYPVHRDRKGYLLPLFMAEAEVELQGEQAVLRLVHPASIQVNLHLFDSTHPHLLEQMGLQTLLESSDFGTFDARLQKALEEREEKSNLIEELVTPARNKGWKNRSLVFRDTGGVFTHQLRSELAEMSQKDLAREAMGTALEKLLGSGKQTKGSPHPADLLEIVPLNPSQRAAARAALSEGLTVITGPPGTGKSRVVINLVASMEAAGQRVLFASKNNRAVDVVREKIGEILGCDDWTLRLGSKKMIDEEKTVRIEQAMGLEGSKAEMIIERSEELGEHLQGRDGVEKECACASLAVARYADSLSALRKRVGELPVAWREWWDSECALDWPEATQGDTVRRKTRDVRALSGAEWPGLRLWFLRFLQGPRLRQKYEDDFRELSCGAPNTIPGWRYERSAGWEVVLEDYEVLHTLYECRRATEDFKRALSDLEKERLVSEFKEESEKYCEAIEVCARDTCRALVRDRVMAARRRLPTLLTQYFDLTERAANLREDIAERIQQDFSRAANGLLNVTPAVIVTSLSARRSLPSEAGMFDCVIIDEASQCDIASALPLLLRAKRVVVIGDPLQLRHVSSIKDEKEQELAQRERAAELLARYSYCKKSLFDCAAETYEESGQEPFFLAEHYRSHPKIIEFSNRTYYRPKYKKALIIRSGLEDQEDAPVLWHDVRSEVDRARGSLLNEEEAREVARIAEQIVRDGSLRDGWTMGIVTPYKRQRNRIESLLQNAGLSDMLGSRLRVGTVHTFQGSEADIMVFSPVVSQGAAAETAEWISKEEGLLNVALTRARRVLHIVGDKEYCAQTPGPLGDLAKFVDQLNGGRHAVPDGRPAIAIVREMLTTLEACYQEEWPEERYHLDFLVVGLSGTPYDIEIDGRQHYFSAEAIIEDEARDEFLRRRGYKVIRIRAVTVERYPDSVRALLSRLA